MYSVRWRKRKKMGERARERVAVMPGASKASVEDG